MNSLNGLPESQRKHRSVAGFDMFHNALGFLHQIMIISKTVMNKLQKNWILVCVNLWFWYILLSDMREF